MCCARWNGETNIGSQHIGPDFADVLGIRLICVFLSLSQRSAVCTVCLCCAVLCCWLPLVSVRFGRCFDSVSLLSFSLLLLFPLIRFCLILSFSLCVYRAYLLRFVFRVCVLLSVALLPTKLLRCVSFALAIMLILLLLFTLHCGIALVPKFRCHEYMCVRARADVQDGFVVSSIIFFLFASLFHIVQLRFSFFLLFLSLTSYSLLVSMDFIWDSVQSYTNCAHIYMNWYMREEVL